MKLKKYDLILIKKPRGIVGKLVKKTINSRYSHVAIYIGGYHVIDTDLFRSVSIHEINNALGEFDVYRYRGYLEEYQEKCIDEFFMKSLNARYDFLEAIGVWLKLNFRMERRFICISLVEEAFKCAGVKVDFDKFGFDRITENNKFYKVNGGMKL